MRIKRIFAANTREALRKVKEQHGPDAVVLSSRSIDGGVEVISAIDYDEDAVQAAARAQDPRANEIPPLEGSPGPRPGEPDRNLADMQGFDAPGRAVNSAPEQGHGNAVQGSDQPNGAGSAADATMDDASRARQAALARLRRLRADGVADNALPLGVPGGSQQSDSAEQHNEPLGPSSYPTQPASLAELRSVAADHEQQPANSAFPSAGGDPGSGHTAATGDSPRRRFTAEDLAGSGGGRLDLRVGGDEDEDAELFAALSREHSQRERQREASSSAQQHDASAQMGTASGRGQQAWSRRNSAFEERADNPRQGRREGGSRKRRGGDAQDFELQQMREEISALRDLFESQLSLLEWGRMGRRHPARAGVIKRLSDLGLGSDISKRLAEHIGSDEDPNSAFRKALALVARHLPIAGDEIVNQGGVVALVGPTGVGKTTTVAKLAARYALRHGRDKVALVSTDNYRVGAQDQLLTYARILDVPVYTATNRHELRNVVDDLAGRGLVLIDTVGMSQRDVRLAEQFKTLGSAEGLVRTYLVLSAATQLSTLTDSVSAFTGASPVGCILTKVDEATTLGGALTCALRTRLPLAYLATGQRVPEDLQAARGDTLIHRACVLLDEHKQELDEDALALSLGGGANAPE